MHAITAGTPTKVSGIPGTDHEVSRMTTEAAATAAAAAPPEEQSYGERLRANIRTGNVGSAPVLIALVDRLRRLLDLDPNFVTPINFTNFIGQMVGTCLLAYGVVFVLLIGEIDLSIGYVSGMAGMIVGAAATAHPFGPDLPGWLCIVIALVLYDGDRRLPGLVRRPDGRAVVRRHAGRPTDLAGRDPAARASSGVIAIQDNKINDFSATSSARRGAGSSAAIVSVAVRRRHARLGLRRAGGTASRSATRSCSSRSAWSSRRSRSASSGYLNKDRGVPFALLLSS